MPQRFQLKGISISRTRYGRACSNDGCSRQAYYKFIGSSGVSKAARAAVAIKTGYGKYVNGLAYFCSYDCARKKMLDSYLSAKMKMTPSVKAFLGLSPNKVAIQDFETILNTSTDINLVSNYSLGKSDRENYLKVSPNGNKDQPYLVETSIDGINTSFSFTKDGLTTFISSLQNLLNNENNIEKERKYFKKEIV